MNIYLEIFGYIGTALVLLSMMMTSVVKLRWFNIAGSVISAVYAALSNTWPVVVLNVSLIAINTWQLIRLGKTKTVFTYVAADWQDNSLQYFLKYFQEDIRRYFPDCSITAADAPEVHMVYAGAEPVGVLLGKREGTQLFVALDYATPKYRDCSVAAFLFAQLKQQGITELAAHKTIPDHNQYLTKMGFHEVNGRQIKKL